MIEKYQHGKIIEKELSGFVSFFCKFNLQNFTELSRRSVNLQMIANLKEPEPRREAEFAFKDLDILSSTCCF